MKAADLSPEILEKIKAVRFDRIYEKHEGPWKWSYWLDIDEVEFIQMSGYEVLLPIHKDRYPNITSLRVIPSVDANTLTIFFKDTTYSGDTMDAGYLAVCEKFPGENFFVATVYHEWYVLDNPLFNTD